jgi:hypothetical protein
MNPFEGAGRRKAAAIWVVAAGMLAVAAFPGQKVDKSIPKDQRTLALGEGDVKRLLLLMDKDKSGELDPKELTQSKVRSSRPAAGKE